VRTRQVALTTIANRTQGVSEGLQKASFWWASKQNTHAEIGAVQGPFARLGPCRLPVVAAPCRNLPDLERNYLIFLDPRPLCMIGDLGPVLD
jgi:hypothetical protein